MHLSERGAVEVKLVVDHFVYSFLHFVHIVDGHYSWCLVWVGWCCTRTQPTVSLNFTNRFCYVHLSYLLGTLSSTRTILLTPGSAHTTLVVEEGFRYHPPKRWAKIVTHFWSFFYDRCSRYLPVCLEKDIHFSLSHFCFNSPFTVRCTRGVFFSMMGRNLTKTHGSLNCAVSLVELYNRFQTFFFLNEEHSIRQSITMMNDR